MKKRDSKPAKINTPDDMRDEYDFSKMKGGVQGKYYQAMREGYTITIHQANGTAVVKEVEPQGAILLEPDVREYFPDSEAVNNALRCLIPLVSKKRRARAKP